MEKDDVKKPADCSSYATTRLRKVVRVLEDSISKKAKGGGDPPKETVEQYLNVLKELSSLEAGPRNAEIHALRVEIKALEGRVSRMEAGKAFQAMR